MLPSTVFLHILYIPFVIKRSKKSNEDLSQTFLLEIVSVYDRDYQKAVVRVKGQKKWKVKFQLAVFYNLGLNKEILTRCFFSEQILGIWVVIYMCSLMPQWSSALDSSFSVVKVWVLAPVMALVSVSKTLLSFDCFVLRMGKNAGRSCLVAILITLHPPDHREDGGLRLLRLLQLGPA